MRQMWKNRRNFLTPVGSEVSHENITADLLESSQLQQQISKIHCRAHTRQQDEISKGNKFVNQAKERANKVFIGEIETSLIICRNSYL